MHTKAPWSIPLRHEPMMPQQSCILYANGGIKLAKITWNFDLYRSDIMDADARLIAAAPELLEACKAYLSLDKDCIFMELHAKMKAAIAKAEEKEQL